MALPAVVLLKNTDFFTKYCAQSCQARINHKSQSKFYKCFINKTNLFGLNPSIPVRYSDLKRMRYGKMRQLFTNSFFHRTLPVTAFGERSIDGTCNY